MGKDNGAVSSSLSPASQTSSEPFCPSWSLRSLHKPKETEDEIHTTHGLQTYRPTDLQTYRPTDLQAYRPTDLQAYRPTDLQAYRPTGLQTYIPTDLQAYSPTGLQTYRPTGLQTYIPTDLQAYRPTGLQAYRPTGLQTYRPTGLQTYRPTDLQTYRPTGLETYRPTDLHAYIPTDLQAYRPTDLQTYMPTDLQTYMPTDLQAYRPTDLQTYRPTDLQAYRSTDLQTYRPTGLQTYRPTGLQAYRPTDLQTYRPTGLQTYRPTGLQAYRPTDLQTVSVWLLTSVALSLLSSWPFSPSSSSTLLFSCFTSCTTLRSLHSHARFCISEADVHPVEKPESTPRPSGAHADVETGGFRFRAVTKVSGTDDYRLMTEPRPLDGERHGVQLPTTRRRKNSAPRNQTERCPEKPRSAPRIILGTVRWPNLPTWYRGAGLVEGGAKSKHHASDRRGNPNVGPDASNT
ncbi:hypothetical protein EYF80_040769 [Liparis tanakae]|uniref:Uncharacterized protein n=1 Tax=Liparis tanakae TaxID=230148 RepID=A0A4Z2G612_9TELE|nr:hypothetical protein EYF80_040769 [Liparis tanakae]